MTVSTTTLGAGLTGINTSILAVAGSTQTALGSIDGSVRALQPTLGQIAASIAGLGGQIAASIAAANSNSATVSAGAGEGGGGGGFANGGWGGGWTNGPGSSMSDGIDAKLSPGEFVVNARAANKNRGVLQRMNGGYSTGGDVKTAYATGGEVYSDGTGSNFTYQDQKGGVQFRTQTVYTDGSQIKISPQTTPDLFNPATNPHYYDFLSAAVPWDPDPGLAAYGPVLPAGLSVLVPVPGVPDRTTSDRLWE